MTTQPEALRLAGELESGLPVTGSAAAELRRLYAENEAAHAVGIQQEQMLMDYEAQRDELLAALQYLMVASGEQLTTAFEQAEQAIAKVEGGK